MSQTNGGIRHLLGYQQQDAQEFFQYLSSLVTNEQTAFYRRKLTLLDPLFLQETDPYGLFGTRKISWRPPNRFHSPLTGLLASGILCKICNHQTTLQHNTFDNLSLPVNSSYVPSVHSMIKSYTLPELMEDYICEKCSLVSTIVNAEYVLKRLTENMNANALSPGTVSKKSKDKAKRRKSKASKEEQQLRKSIEKLRDALLTQDFDIKMVQLCFTLARGNNEGQSVNSMRKTDDFSFSASLLMSAYTKIYDAANWSSGQKQFSCTV